MPQIKRFVIAGNYQQARQWAEEQDLHPREWLYVSQARDLRGYAIDRSQVEWVGTFYERRDIRDIREAVVQAAARGEAQAKRTQQVMGVVSEETRRLWENLNLPDTFRPNLDAGRIAAGRVEMSGRQAGKKTVMETVETANALVRLTTADNQRLRRDLDAAADKVRRLEELLAESNQKVKDLEAALTEMQPLKEEAELLRRHAKAVNVSPGILVLPEEFAGKEAQIRFTPISVTAEFTDINEDILRTLTGKSINNHSTDKDQHRMYDIPKNLFTLTDGTKVNKMQKGYALVLPDGTLKAHTIRVGAAGEFQAYDSNMRLILEGKVKD